MHKIIVAVDSLVLKNFAQNLCNINSDLWWQARKATMHSLDAYLPADSFSHPTVPLLKVMNYWK